VGSQARGSSQVKTSQVKSSQVKSSQVKSSHLWEVEPAGRRCGGDKDGGPIACKHLHHAQRGLEDRERIRVVIEGRLQSTLGRGEEHAQTPQPSRTVAGDRSKYGTLQSRGELDGGVGRRREDDDARWLGLRVDCIRGNQWGNEGH